MPMQKDRPEDEAARILRFRHRRSDELDGPAGREKPVEGLDRYEHDEDADDYRHRMLVNVAAFLLVGGLIGAGLWIANTMAEMRKNQDCALQGRRNCTPIDVVRERR
jgi:hypothetical protein